MQGRAFTRYPRYSLFDLESFLFDFELEALPRVCGGLADLEGGT